MAKPQVILDDEGNPAFAVLSWEEYGRLVSKGSGAHPGGAGPGGRAESRDGESFPVDVADRLLAGENAVKVYRTHRGLTQKQLAEAAGIHAVYLSQIERGRRTGSARTLAAIAEALEVDVGALIRTVSLPLSAARGAAGIPGGRFSLYY